MARLGFQTTLYSGMKAKASRVVEKNISLEEAQALQTELSSRARTPVDDDQSLVFDSSVSREQMRARFMAMVQRSREVAFA